MSDKKLESLCDAAEAIAELIRDFDGMSKFRAKDRAFYEKCLQKEKKWRDYIGKCRKLQEDMIFKVPKYRKICAEEEKLSRKIEATEKELSEKNEGGKTGPEDVQDLANLLDELKNRHGSVLKKRDDLHASLSGPYEQAKAKIKKPDGPDPREWLTLPQSYPTINGYCAAWVLGFDPKRVPFHKVLGPLARYFILTIIHDKVLGGPTVGPINKGIWPENEALAEYTWEKLSDGWKYSEVMRAEIKEAIEAVKADLREKRPLESEKREGPNQLDSKAGQGEKPKIEPLGDNAAAVYELLKALPKHRGITGKEILKQLEQGENPIIIEQSTLTKNIIPALRAYGVKNKPGAGYFISE